MRLSLSADQYNEFAKSELKNGGSATIKAHSTKMMFVALDNSNVYQALQTKKGLRK